MAGELENPKIPQQAQQIFEQAQQEAGDLEQEFGELRQTLSRDSQTLAQSASGAARPRQREQAADEGGLDWAVKNVPGARYPLALGYGAVYTVPGVLNSGMHALTHPFETAGKWGMGVGFGAVMRTVLPKTGAGRAIAGTLMLGWFVKDALTPIASGMVDAHHAQGLGDVEKAGAKMGDGMGAFLVDSAIGVHGGIIGEKWAGGALKGTRLSQFLSSDKSVAVAETIGLPKLVGKERFQSAVSTLKTDGLTQINLPALMNRPGFATAAEKVGLPKVFGKERFEGWKSSADRFEHWEAGKEAAFKSDNNFVGRNLNRLQAGADRLSAAWAEKLGRKPEAPPKQVSIDETIAMLSKLEARYIAHIEDYKITKLGMLDVEGKPHGYIRTLDLLDAGVDPAKVKVSDPIPGGRKSGEGLEEALAGLRQTVREVGANTEANRLIETEVVAATERAAAQAGLTETQTAVLKEINAGVVRKISDSTDAVLNSKTPEQRQMEDVLEAWMEIIHVANSKKHNPLDPGYKIARDQAQAIIKEVQTIEHLKQVGGLISRFADASRQHMASDLGPNQRLVQFYNMLAKEMHTGLKQRLRAAGADPDVVLQNKNPALVSRREDGGVGPHTMREIDGVFDVDHVFFPSNFTDIRSRTMGTWWHEFWHDQYGGLAKLPQLSRSQFLDDVVKEGLGDRAGVMVDVPGHGKKPLQEAIVQILKAQADENTADIGGGGHGGQNTAVQLMDYLLAVRRDPNNPALKPQLSNRSVMGERFVEEGDNPWGIEGHAHDVIRPLIVAAVMENRAKASLAAGKDAKIAERIMAEAQAIRQTARELGPKSDELVWLNIDKPGEALRIKRSDMEAVIPKLIDAYMKAELQGAGGEKNFTFGQLLPDIVDTYGRMHRLSEMMAEGITKGKDPSTYVIDKSVYSMQEIMGAGQPTMQKLVAAGIDAGEANAAINRFSDEWMSRFIDSNPHIEPIVSPVARKLTSQPIKAIKEMAGNAIARQPNLRHWSDRHAVHIGGATGSLLVGDVFDLRSKLRTRLLTGEMSAMEQARREIEVQPR